jgi:predicted dehydrogenase
MARLGVGIIGLGQRWRRYRLALCALRAHFVVQAVCDQTFRRAERVAHHLSCTAAAGPTDLLERDDIDAVLLLDEQWFRLWPVERACELGKPVLCATSLLCDEAHADALRGRLQASRAPVLLAPAVELVPLVSELRRLRDTTCGQPRLVRIDWPVGLDHPMVLALLRTCVELLGEPPVSLSATGTGGGTFTGVVLDFSTGRVGHLGLWAGPPAGSACRIEVVGEHGTATGELPRRVRWRDAGGQHTLCLPATLPEQALLLEFAQMVQAKQPSQSGFEEMYQALLWLRAVRRSLAEQRRVALGETGA